MFFSLQGMVLVSKELMGAYLEFEADIYVLYHDTRICTGFQTTIHIGNVCQTVQVQKIKDKVCTVMGCCFMVQLSLVNSNVIVSKSALCRSQSEVLFTFLLCSI